MTFHGRVTCQFAPLFHCDLHQSGMSCKKGDAFRCTGAGFRESETFASQFHWDLQFQSCVLEVLNRSVTLGFAVARWFEKLRFCDKSQVKRRFWRMFMRVEVVKIIPNARKSYNFGCLEESDKSHFSWQAQHIVDLKVEKGDFAAQAQGFVKVTRLRLTYIGICSFRVVF